MSNSSMKREVLEEIRLLTVSLDNKVEILNALDRDVAADGAYDMHDQLTTFYEVLETLQNVRMRSLGVIPENK